MIHRLETDMKRRREEMFQFYYKGIGISIKKRRLALSLTQEALAKGICSNTYVSKIENNAIAINRENLFLIMERMQLPIEAIAFPERMVDIMIESFQCFIRKDIERYKEIYEEIATYEFGILIQVTRFGYHVLLGDTEAARPLYNELFRYLSSLEQYGLMVFVIYACWYDILNANYRGAKTTLAIAGDQLVRNRDMLAMCHLIEFIVHGSLHCFNGAKTAYDLAKTMFLETNNLARLAEMRTYGHLFALYENKADSITFVSAELAQLSSLQRNRYLALLALEAADPEIYAPHFDKDAKYYQDYLFILAVHYAKTGQAEKLADTKTALSENHYLRKAPLDYLNLLELMRDEKSMEYKDCLSQIVLPYVIREQNLYLIEKTTRTIVRILEKRKRYKDALAYQEKCRKTIQRLKASKSAEAEPAD